MGYSLCIIDDGFMEPAKTRSLEGYRNFSISTIEVFLSDDWGVENSLKKLCEALISDIDESKQKKWQLTAFTNPQFFNDSFDEDDYRSDIIVFDWDYSAPHDFDHVGFLKDILSKSYSYIFIFSGADKEYEIKKILDESLKEYGYRIEFLDKDNEDDQKSAAIRLHKLIQEKQDSNFSFKFGRQLRSIANKSLDDVLVHLSEMDIEKIIEHFGKESDGVIDTDVKELIGYKIKDKLTESKNLQDFLTAAKLMTLSAIGQFAEIISEKVKNDIISSDLSYDYRCNAGGSGENDDILHKFWCYRLYHMPSDNFVRTGDLIKKTNEGYEELYLVVTPLCHLARFWSKAFGQLNLVKLYDIHLKKDYIKSQAELVKKTSDLKSAKSDIISISNPLSKYGGNALYIPFIRIGEKYNDYILFPKEISCEKIELPDEKIELTDKKARDGALTYDYINKYKRVATLSDPFITPIIGNILSALKGYGAPDYSMAIAKSLGARYLNIYE